MENLGIASVAAITVISYLMGMAVRASRMDNKWIPILCGLLGGLLGLGRRLVVIAEQPVQERERGGLAALLIVLLPALRQVVHLLRTAEGLHHLRAEALQILRRDAHALHHILHLGQTQLGGALKAKSLVDHLVLLVHPGNEHDGHVFLTFGTKCGLHGIPPSSVASGM
ncbi:MAG: hypothetical protein EGR01_00200 [Clostridiales bacterium]|nr:hypothetical protein [Clostridiales bacterium]